MVLRLASVVLPARIDHDAWLKRALAVMLFLAAVALLKIDRARGRRLWPVARVALCCFPSGLAWARLQALTSAGSGSLLTPILASTTDWKVPQMAAVSNLFGAFVGALSVGLYFKLGDFNVHLSARFFWACCREWWWEACCRAGFRATGSCAVSPP